jgi:hypothetical protein
VPLLAPFLSQVEVAPLLSLCKGARRGVLLTIDRLEFQIQRRVSEQDEARKARALIRLLRQAPNLQRLGLFLSPSGVDDATGEVVAAIADGSVGAKLRSLSVSKLAEWQLERLLRALTAGRLPLLAEIDLPSDVDIRRFELIEVLEARRDAGLQPVTSLGSTTRYLMRGDLRRLWACCPPHAMTHLEARGRAQLQALELYMQAHPAISTALRTLKLGGSWSRLLGDFEPLLIEEWRLLDWLPRGQAPMIEELVLDEWELAIGNVNCVTRAILKSKLTRLSSLTLGGYGKCGEHCNSALFKALRNAPRMTLLSLTLKKMDGLSCRGVCDAFRHHSGALRKLEALHISDAPCSTIFSVLTEGIAPCARTLRSISVGGSGLTWPALRTLLQGLRDRCFPCLASLSLDAVTASAAVKKHMMQELADALVGMAGKGKACRLEQLTVKGGLDLETVWAELTRIFSAHALPRGCSITVDAGVGSYKGIPLREAKLVEGWASLGPKVTATRLKLLIAMPDTLKHKLINALADPQFCPSLVCTPSFGPWRGIYGRGLKASLDKAWLQREIKAGAAPCRPLRVKGAASAAPTTKEMTAEEMRARIKELKRKNRELRRRVVQLEDLIYYNTETEDEEDDYAY